MEKNKMEQTSLTFNMETLLYQGLHVGMEIRIQKCGFFTTEWKQ